MAEKTPSRQDEKASAPRPSRILRALAWTIVTLLVLILLLAGLILGAVSTETGTRLLWRAATRALPDRLSGEFAGGSLTRGIELRNVGYRDATKQVRIDSVNGGWDLSFSPLALTVNYLRTGDVDVTLLPSPPTPRTPTSLPDQITLPLAIDLQQLSVKQVLIHKEESTTELRDILLRAGSDRMQHRIDLDNAVTPYGTLRASLRLNGKRPFATSGSVSMNGPIRDESYRAAAQLSGSLQHLGVRLDVMGDRLAGNADIDATPFDPVPFRRALLHVAHLNPRLFTPGAPQADLDIRAALEPVTGSGQAASPQAFAVAGPVSISNARPGTLDAQLLPLASASADVRLDTEQQQLSRLQIRLRGGASLDGGGELRGNGQGRFTLRASGLDLHALHAKLKTTRLDGPLSIRVDGTTRDISLDLAGPELSAKADARLTPQQIELQAAQLKSGPAQLKLSGSLSRDQQSAYAFKGSLSDFNPAHFLATMQPKGARGKSGKQLPDTRINMNFSAQGKLQPELSAQLQFAIRDSMYASLPMTGAGTVHLAGKRLLPSDANLSIAGNQLRLKGSFGAPGERMDFNIDAPALDRLGFGLSGLLQAQGRLGGTLQRPVVDADYRAERIAFGEHRLAQLSGQAHLNGVPGEAPDARVALGLEARGLQSGEIRLDKFTADISGTYASHTIGLHANGRLRGQVVALSLSAQGRLRDSAQGLAWDGMLRKLENRGIPRLVMEAPLTLSVAQNRIELGATRLEVEQARIDLKGLRYDDGQLRSEGAFSALNIGRLLALRRELTGAEPPFQTDLALDGSWNVTLGDSAAGFVRIDRRGGDIAIPTGAGESRLGLNTLSLRADMEANRVMLNADINATRIGSLKGQGRLTLQQSGGRLTLTPGAPVSAEVTGTIPKLQSIASLAGPRVALDGSAAINLNVAGTLGDPVLSGTVAGDNLALTLFDQGVRLHDGIARITLDNNIVELRQVEFRGGDGTLRASGRIPIDENSPDIKASIVADKLQLLASPTGQLTLSGQAGVSNVGRQLRINGGFTVDHALFNLREKSAPKLGDDVMIVRGDTPQNAGGMSKTSAKAAGPFSPVVDIEVNLGRDFRFEGSGANVRLAGTIAVQSVPGEAPQAKGTVRVVEGSYEAFGTKLAIERGVITFQGPLGNPSLNILAMRRDQEVAAGVQVTGTVQQPRVELVSEPNVADEQKLSWLIFGRGGGSSEQGQAQAAARGAATGLLNKFGGERIAKGLGLDQLSIGTSEYGQTTQQVVNLGKEVSDRLTVGYEQSLTGAAGVLRLTYELSRHWSVVVRGGTIGGLDVFFNQRFDRIRGR
ncbi:translocation/assembly module TamB domain-containing protein [Noviherbaspirillum massiliense]|uniref:translocation/assembly module TamB domain-containing protein n=1 Tax=Noviherbaspirillum massiliense TaxID=1465823 RepID=UPI0002FD6CD7|nr:translocation/assembly module TamB domain-containing protein [Noviherbaspirillum massiliense]